MSVPLANLPSSPLNIATAPVVASSVPIVATVTLTTPTTATLVTGMTASVTIPLVAQFLRLTAYFGSVTQSAAATSVIGFYTGATTGALTTLQAAVNYITPTGGTQNNPGSYSVLIPVTAFAASPAFPQAGSTAFISVAATASTGNFVVNGAATTPATLLVEVL